MIQLYMSTNPHPPTHSHLKCLLYIPHLCLISLCARLHFHIISHTNIPLFFEPSDRHLLIIYIFRRKVLTFALPVEGLLSLLKLHIDVLQLTLDERELHLQHSAPDLVVPLHCQVQVGQKLAEHLIL